MSKWTRDTDSEGGPCVHVISTTGMVGKMAKDVGTAIRKTIVVLFLPCLVAFLGFHPYMVLHSLKFFCNLFLLFFRGNKRSLQRCVVID